MITRAPIPPLLLLLLLLLRVHAHPPPPLFFVSAAVRVASVRVCATKPYNTSFVFSLFQPRYSFMSARNAK